MWDASFVAAPFGVGDNALGTIGVVGPTRMDYAAAIAAVRAVADRLSEAVQALCAREDEDGLATARPLRRARRLA